MYANLKITLTPRSVESQPDEELFAWLVEMSPGVASIYLDANNGEGNYAEEAGVREVDLDDYRMKISADF